MSGPWGLAFSPEFGSADPPSGLQWRVTIGGWNITNAVIRDIVIRAGRDDDQGQPEAGTATLRILAPDRLAGPVPGQVQAYPNAAPGTNIVIESRVNHPASSGWRAAFTGQIAQVKRVPSHLDGGQWNTEIQITASGPLAIAARRMIPTNALRPANDYDGRMVEAIFNIGRDSVGSPLYVDTDDPDLVCNADPNFVAGLAAWNATGGTVFAGLPGQVWITRTSAGMVRVESRDFHNVPGGIVLGARFYLTEKAFVTLAALNPAGGFIHSQTVSGSVGWNDITTSLGTTFPQTGRTVMYVTSSGPIEVAVDRLATYKTAVEAEWYRCVSPDVAGRPCLEAARDIAESARAVIWETRAGGIYYEPNRARKNQVAPMVVIPRDAIMTDLETVQDTSDKVNAVTATYGTAPASGSRPTVTERDAADYAASGNWGRNIDTWLETAADARTVAKSLLRAKPRETLRQVTLLGDPQAQDGGLGAALTDQVLGLPLGALVQLADMPAAVLPATTWQGFVEGYEVGYRFNGSQESLRITLKISQA